MKVIIATPQLYNENVAKCRSKTGFSIILREICEGVAQENIDTKVFIQLANNKNCIDKKVRYLKNNVLSAMKFVKFDYIKLAITLVKELDKKSFSNIFRVFYWCITGSTLERYIREYKPEVVHIHSIMSPALAMIMACVRTNTKFLVSLHALAFEGNNDNTNNFSFNYIERNFINLAEKKNILVTTVSSGMKQNLKKKYALDFSENIYVVNNGTNILNLKNKKINLNIKEKYNIENKKSIVLCIGNLSIRKNQIFLIESIKDMPINIRKKYHFLFLGTNTLGNKPYELIQKFNLKECVTLCGFVEREELPFYYEQADFNILVSLNEGFGLSIIEAAVYGIPTLSYNDLEGVADLYDPVFIQVLSDRNRRCLIDGFEKFVNFQWDRKEIKCIGMQYTIRNMCRKYISLYPKTELLTLNVEDVVELGRKNGK